ncbi:MAG: HDIG domain-containing protein [Chloroflexi bacterium]|nr:HDIG domain-containing protein [Chloroflexota bacterium]
MSASSSRLPWQRILFLIVLMLLSGGAMLAIVVYSPTLSNSVGDLRSGEVASQDILAPSAISYESQVRTEQQRELAFRTVTPKYTQADTNIARGQLEQLRAALAYITSVRADSYASQKQKLADLAALQGINLSQDKASDILALNDTRWTAVQQEAIVVLEQVMRNTIREDRLVETISSVPNLVSLALPADQALMVADLVSAFITPNSFYSESLTESARQQAVDAVVPAKVSFAAGEVVVRRGEVVSEEDIEALRHMGLARPERRWQETASAGILVILACGLAIIFVRRNPKRAQKRRGLLMVAILFLAFLGLGRLSLPMHALTPYLFPLPAYALIMASLFGEELALVSVMPLIILTVYGHPNTAVLTLFYGVSSLFGVLIPKREQRISAYLWVGITMAASGAAIITAFHLIQPEINLVELAVQTSTTLLNGLIAAGLTVLLQYLLAPLLGQITPLQLLELSRPDNPLLEYLLRNAPGTYQHSLQVANLAEQAAERIGANSLLTRVGALYHDIGKAQNPYFFIENQIPGKINTHEDLAPTESAAVIIKHIADGQMLAKEHRLPNRIKAFIAEHHGRLKARYQWTQAVNAANGDETRVNDALFTYPGPRPQSRETALVMLADGCEARIHSQKPETEEQLARLVRETIENRLAQNQLDNTPLTLQDLKIIAESFIASLRGIYHPRVDYPTLNIPAQLTPKIAEKVKD